MADFRMDKSVVRIVPMHAPDDEPDPDLLYWLSRPMAERMAAVNFLSLQAWGLKSHDRAASAPRLSRLCVVSQRPRR